VARRLLPDEAKQLRILARRATQESNLRPTAPERGSEQKKQHDSGALQSDDPGRCAEQIHVDAPRGEAGRHEASAPAGELLDELRRAGESALSVDDAIRIAIRLAVDAKDYERAAALLDVLKSKGSPTSR
jgi:hypothetical protein